jgi:hypothetical protein
MNSRTKITFAVKRVKQPRVQIDALLGRIVKYVWSSCDDRGTSSTNSKTSGTYYRTDIILKRTTRGHILT